MLAVKDENVVNAAQAARQAPGKPSGARFPKTPSRLPLNDENVVEGRTGLGKGKGTMQQSAMQRKLVTPSGEFGHLLLLLQKATTLMTETQARAPLGNKTTNAKAKASQNAGVKDIVKDFERTQQAKPTTVKKPRQKAPAIDPLKVSVHNDNKSLEEPDVEYAPPKPKELPYESDVFPDGTLTFEGLKRGNMFKGCYDHFYNPMGDDGMRLQDRKHEERMQKALKEHDEVILREIEAIDWSIPGVPGSEKLAQRKDGPIVKPTTAREKQHATLKYPPTINSRRAASALSAGAGSTIRQKPVPHKMPPARRPLSSILPSQKTNKVPAPPKTGNEDGAVGEAASRSTLGYTKGRTASSYLNRRNPTTSSGQGTIKPKPLSAAPGTTVKQATAVPIQRAHDNDPNDLHSLQFLSIFQPDIEDEGDLGGEPQFDDDWEEDFELKLV